eukprot:scaffold161434_cov30-Tisochrysis_lutea.AAC.4
MPNRWARRRGELRRGLSFEAENLRATHAMPARLRKAILQCVATRRSADRWCARGRWDGFRATAGDELCVARKPQLGSRVVAVAVGAERPRPHARSSRCRTSQGHTSRIQRRTGRGLRSRVDKSLSQSPRTGGRLGLLDSRHVGSRQHLAGVSSWRSRTANPTVAAIWRQERTGCRAPDRRGVRTAAYPERTSPNSGVHALPQSTHSPLPSPHLVCAPACPAARPASVCASGQQEHTGMEAVFDDCSQGQRNSKARGPRRSRLHTATHDEGYSHRPRGCKGERHAPRTSGPPSLLCSGTREVARGTLRACCTSSACPSDPATGEHRLAIVLPLRDRPLECAANRRCPSERGALEASAPFCASRFPYDRRPRHEVSP